MTDSEKFTEILEVLLEINTNINYGHILLANINKIPNEDIKRSYRIAYDKLHKFKHKRYIEEGTK